MKRYPFNYSWQITSAATPRQLWPYISDTNRFFKDLGQLPVQEAMISHDLPRHYAQLEYDHLRRSDIWLEEPYRWEAPHYLKIHRDYQRGPYEELSIKIELIPVHDKKGAKSRVSLSFEGVSRGFMGAFRTKTHFNGAFKQRLKYIVGRYDESIQSKSLPANKRSSIIQSLKTPGKWRDIEKKLVKATNEPDISSKLIELLRYSDEQDLKMIEPLKLSDLWSVSLHRVLSTAYRAVSLNILNMEWRQVCPRCRRTLKISRRLLEISSTHYCNHCGDTMDLDLNNTTQVVFKSHPLVRKLSDDAYCVSGPQERPHVITQQYIKPGDKHYVNLMLPDGKYRVRTDTLDRDIHVRPDLEGLNNVTMTLEEGEKDDGETLLSPDSDMIVKNRADHPLLISIEDRQWLNYGVSAAEVTSQQLFRECFPGETLRQSQKIKCDDLTVLFTDLIDSSSMYSDSGDEEAIRKVIDHFEVLRKIIFEERGAIVKTIGDAIMAVFRQPASAVRAFQKAQELFFNSDESDLAIRLKGGLHHGSCYAVTLNNRIDYFGNTVNLAARLVEKANRDELIVSSKTFENPHLQSLLDQDDMFCKTDSFSSELKGFGDQQYTMKRLSLHKPALKLVI